MQPTRSSTSSPHLAIAHPTGSLLSKATSNRSTRIRRRGPKSAMVSSRLYNDGPRERFWAFARGLKCLHILVIVESQVRQVGKWFRLHSWIQHEITPEHALLFYRDASPNSIAPKHSAIGDRPPQSSMNSLLGAPRKSKARGWVVTTLTPIHRPRGLLFRPAWQRSG